MNCPNCFRNLDEKIERGVLTGRWKFRFTCECGRNLAWEAHKLTVAVAVSAE